MPAPHYEPLSRPIEQPKQVCAPILKPPQPATTFCYHFTAVDNPHTTTTLTDPVPESIPSSSATSTSKYSSSDSDDTQSTGNTPSTNDTQSTNSKTLIPSAVSDRQLCPRYPINYNETLLKRLQGKPQTKTFNNIPTTDTEPKYTESEAEDKNEHCLLKSQH